MIHRLLRWLSDEVAVWQLLYHTVRETYDRRSHGNENK
jgi:hypothetical protein